MCSRCCGSRWGRVSYRYNLAGVLDLHTFAELALRVMAVRDAGGAWERATMIVSVAMCEAPPPPSAAQGSGLMSRFPLDMRPRVEY
jgi:hypothetical protein